MQLHKTLQQEIISAVNKTLDFESFYHRIRPDISTFIAVTSDLQLKNWMNGSV